MSEKNKLNTEIMDEVVKHVETSIEIIESPIIETPIIKKDAPSMEYIKGPTPIKSIIDVEPSPQLDTENCVPCQEKAFVEIADGICKDAEMNEGIEKGKCAIPLERLSKNEITLPEYATEVKNLLPNEQKIAYDALLEVADEKGINVK